MSETCYLVPASLLRAVLRGQGGLEPVDLVSVLLVQAMPGSTVHDLARVLGPRSIDAWASVGRLEPTAFLEVEPTGVLLDDCGMAEPDQRVRMCRLHSDLRAAVEGLK